MKTYELARVDDNLVMIDEIVLHQMVAVINAAKDLVNGQAFDDVNDFNEIEEELKILESITEEFGD